MPSIDLKDRTKSFAVRVIRLVKALPKNIDGKIIGNQLIRCGTSVGSNYRAVCRSRSKAEFIFKLGIVIEEADESSFWLEIIIEIKLLKENLVKPLLNEANEIISIVVASSKKVKSNIQNSKILNS